MSNTKDMSPNAITVRFCEAIFRACPWVAPQSFVEREERIKDVMDRMHEQMFGMKP